MRVQLAGRPTRVRHIPGWNAAGASKDAAPTSESFEHVAEIDVKYESRMLCVPSKPKPKTHGNHIPIPTEPHLETFY